MVASRDPEGGTIYGNHRQMATHAAALLLILLSGVMLRVRVGVARDDAHATNMPLAAQQLVTGRPFSDAL